MSETANDTTSETLARYAHVVARNARLAAILELVPYVGEGYHTAIRKLLDTPTAHDLWTAIRELPSRHWNEFSTDVARALLQATVPVGPAGETSLATRNEMAMAIDAGASSVLQKMSVRGDDYPIMRVRDLHTLQGTEIVGLGNYVLDGIPDYLIQGAHRAETEYRRSRAALASAS